MNGTLHCWRLLCLDQLVNISLRLKEKFKVYLSSDAGFLRVQLSVFGFIFVGVE